MKLYCSNGSPFARKVRIVLAEKGLAYEVDIQDRVRPVEEALGPTLAIPVLDDNGRRLWESDLIVEYLLKSYPESKPETPSGPPLSPWMTRPDRHWDDATVLATLATLGSSIVNIRLMRNDNITPENSDYLARQKTRIERCLDWLEERVTDEGFAPGWFSIMDIAFVCPVAFCEAREIMPWRGRRKLDALFDRHRDRPSLVATPVNAKR
jgi:glutathione S-transferase